MCYFFSDTYLYVMMIVVIAALLIFFILKKKKNETEKIMHKVQIMRNTFKPIQNFLTKLHNGAKDYVLVVTMEGSTI